MQMVGRVFHSGRQRKRLEEALQRSAHHQGVVPAQGVAVGGIIVDGAVYGQVGVVFVALEGAGIIERAGPGGDKLRGGPFAVGAHGGRHSLEVLPAVARVDTAVEIVGREVHRPAVNRHLHALTHIEELALHIGLEAGLQSRGTAFAADVHQSRSGFAIFGRGDTAHYLHTLDIVGRDGSHVYSFAGGEAVGACGVGGLLHLGVGIGLDAVDHEGSTERRGGIVVGLCDIFCLTQVGQICLPHFRILTHCPREHFHQIGKARGLQMLHGCLVDERRRGHAASFAGRDHYLTYLGVGRFQCYRDN